MRSSQNNAQLSSSVDHQHGQAAWSSGANNCPKYPVHVKRSYDGEHGYSQSRREVDSANHYSDQHGDTTKTVPPNLQPFQGKTRIHSISDINMNDDHNDPPPPYEDVPPSGPSTFSLTTDRRWLVTAAATHRAGQGTSGVSFNSHHFSMSCL